MGKFIFNIISILFFSVIALSYGCGKKCKNPVKYNLDKGAISLFANGKNGSWWVFQQENSSLRDSIYVSNYNNTINHNEKQCEDNDIVTINFSGQNLFFSTAELKISAEAQNSSDKKWDIISTNCNSGKTFSFSFNRIHDGTFEKSIWLDYEILSNITLSGNSYNDVLKIYIKDYYDNSSNTTTYRILYFAPTIGLIRCENIPNSRHPDNTVYNLLKYHIQ